MDGTRVLVNDVNAAILYASAGRVDFVCPALDPGTVLNVAIVTDAGPSIPMQIKMEETSPGILTLQEFGSRQALATNTQSDELAAIPNFRFLGNPALASDSISIGVTGIKCAENSGQQVLLKIGSSYAQINSVQPDGQAAGICKLTASVPPFRRRRRRACIARSCG